MSHKYDKEECTVFVDKGLWHHFYQSFVSAISSNPIPTLPDFRLPFELNTCSSYYGEGAVLYHRDIDAPQSQQQKVVGYYSNTFLKPQLNFMNMEKGAKNGYVHYFRPYLEGRSFKLFFPTIKPWPISLTSQSLDENLRRGQVNPSSSLTISSNYKNLEGD